MAQDPKVTILITAVDRTKAAMTSIRKNVLGIDTSAAKMIKTLAGGFIVFKTFQALASFVKESYKAFTEFSYSMAQVNTLLDDGGVLAKRYTAEIRAMALELPVKGAKDLSDGLYQVISATIETAHAMDVLRVSAKAAIAGMTDTRTSVDAITTVIKGFGLEATEAEHVADVFFQTIKRGKTTFSELAPEIGNVVAMANQVKISFDDVGAAIAILTQRGIQTSEAITDLTSLITAFLKPTTELNQLAKDYGYITAEDMLVAEGFTNTLKILNENLEKENYEIGQLLGRKQAIIGFYVLAGDELKGLTHEQQLMIESTGAMGRAYDVMADEQISKTQNMKNQWEDFSMWFGENVTSVFVEDLYTMTSATQEFDVVWSNLWKNEGYIIQFKETVKDVADEIENLDAMTGDVVETYKGWEEQADDIVAIGGEYLKSLGEQEFAITTYNDSLEKQNELLKVIPKLQYDIVKADRDVAQSARDVLKARETLDDKLREIEDRPRTLAAKKRALARSGDQVGGLESLLQGKYQELHRAIGWAPEAQQEAWKTGTPEGLKLMSEIQELEWDIADAKDTIIEKTYDVADALRVEENSFRDAKTAIETFNDEIDSWKNRTDDAKTSVETLTTAWEEAIAVITETDQLKTDLDKVTDVVNNFINDQERAALKFEQIWGRTGVLETKSNTSQISRNTGQTPMVVNVYVDGQQIAAKVDQNRMRAIDPFMDW